MDGFLVSLHLNHIFLDHKICAIQNQFCLPGWKKKSFHKSVILELASYILLQQIFLTIIFHSRGSSTIIIATNHTDAHHLWIWKCSEKYQSPYKMSKKSQPSHCSESENLGEIMLPPHQKKKNCRNLTPFLQGSSQAESQHLNQGRPDVLWWPWHSAWTPFPEYSSEAGIPLHQ